MVIMVMMMTTTMMMMMMMMVMVVVVATDIFAVKLFRYKTREAHRKMGV